MTLNQSKLPMPTFKQAGAFAALIGIRTEDKWTLYTAQQTREELFQRVLSVIAGRIDRRILETRLEQS